ncbi:hypothetical protein DC31_05690 [Microbacterium sp. CH12i]|uniref:hypothetical protein n=1 Tax=Microbacterium sp. CH12i TaxID=1479651 RepID=UPI0004620432|nr:hypothetical protein [Microbacterium sp. CH12i]KDA04766.1 hypothetical protein DC31_05690 [Microbacterium sp. CH12i]
MNDSDAVLFAQLRTAIDDADPVPRDLADRMVAAVAVADLSREYALLTLVEGAEHAVRSDAETTTLQFSDGTASVLLHVSHTARDLRRVDGWVDADVIEIRLIQGERSWSVPPGRQGRFAFDDIPPGLTRVQLVTAGETKDLLTPHFEV